MFEVELIARFAPGFSFFLFSDSLIFVSEFFNLSVLLANTEEGIIRLTKWYSSKSNPLSLNVYLNWLENDTSCEVTLTKINSEAKGLHWFNYFIESYN
jgi:hypothetical protein